MILKVANEITANMCKETNACVDVDNNRFRRSANVIWGKFTALL